MRGAAEPHDDEIPEVKNFYIAFPQNRNATRVQAVPFFRSSHPPHHLTLHSMPQPTSQYNPSSSFTWLSHNVRYPSSALTYRGKALSACPNVLFRAPIRAFPHHGKAFSAHRRKPIETATNASLDTQHIAQTSQNSSIRRRRVFCPAVGYSQRVDALRKFVSAPPYGTVKQQAHVKV